MLPFKANRTQIGGLVFGKDDMEPVRKDALEPLVFPKPLLWGALADEPDDAGGGELTLHSAGEPRETPKAGDVGRDLQAQLEGQLQKLQKAFEEKSLLDAHRLMVLEAQAAQAQQWQLQEAILKEQVLTLQADFREFIAKSLGRQMADHAEMEGQVSHALARQSNSVEEWRLAIRQKDAQMQSELEMLSSSVEDLREKLISSQAELRVRLTGLEIRGDGLASGREPCDAEGAYMAQSLEFLKQHVDRLQQGSIHAGAALSELQARVEGEAAARAAAQQEHTSRLEALNQALGFSRALMAQSIAQRVEALEERFGNERQELFARHQRLQHEVASEGQEGSAKMQELAARVANSIVALEKRCLGMETSQQELETHLAETVKAYRSEGSMIKGALAALSKKTEETVSRHSEGVKTFKSQVETSLRQLRELVEVERRARLQDNKRLCDEVTEAAQKAVTADLTTLHSALKKQAENVTIEMDRIRRVNADRADRLSRYVDVALKDAGILPDQSPGRRQAAAEDARLLRDLREQFIALQKELNEQVQGLEQKSSEISEELRSKFARQADWQEDEAKALRREAEQAARDVERRAFCRQEELETRFENYVRHFDNSINSVQAAVLRPYREMFPGGLASEPQDQESTLVPAAVLPPPEAGAGGGSRPSKDGSLDPVTDQVVQSLWLHASRMELPS